MDCIVLFVKEREVDISGNNFNEIYKNAEGERLPDEVIRRVTMR